MIDPMNLILSFGAHDTPEEGMCLMEAVAWLAGEAHSDHPKCACPVIAAYARNLNDRMGEGAEGDALRAKHLLPLATKLVGTRSTPEVEQKRAYFFANRAVRFFAPSALEAAGFTEEAKTLRTLPEIVDEQTARDVAYAAAGTSAWADAAEAAAAARAAGTSAWADARDAAAWAADAAARAAARAASAGAWAAARTAADDADASAWAAGAADAAARTAAAGARTAAEAVWEQAAEVLAEACGIGTRR